MTQISSTLTEASDKVRGLSVTLTDFSNDVTIVLAHVMGVSSINFVMGSPLMSQKCQALLIVHVLSNNANKPSRDQAGGASSTLETNSACERISTSRLEVWEKAADITKKYVYCSFEKKCSIVGPWTRVAYLNMSDSSSTCVLVEHRNLSMDQLLHVGYKKSMKIVASCLYLCAPLSSFYNIFCVINHRAHKNLKKVPMRPKCGQLCACILLECTFIHQIESILSNIAYGR